MFKVKIDGIETEAAPETTILEVANRELVEIPTLCFNDNVEPRGACRICTVEVEIWGRKRLVTACNYPIRGDIVIDTKSEKVMKLRRLILEVLLARTPKSERIQELAKKYGVSQPRFTVEKTDDKCIVCGLCVQVCRDIVGVSALSLSERGILRKPETPFDEASSTCIGCGSCVYICPTDAVTMIDKDGKRFFPRWKTEFKLVKCESCDNLFMTDAQIKYLKKVMGKDDPCLHYCPNCLALFKK
ncbi:MAG: (2Fe-2S)-binding protein [Candidatus Latescibacteria bacterium]|nr:(2Fe-2S)-binding protein [Candidatus Latescibacterota bacterium]